MVREAPAILILAAGASSRMRGEDKLLREIDGTPLLLRAVRAACAVCDRVVVTLPPASPRRDWLGDSPARLIEVATPLMSASIRAGVAACPPGAVLIHLADMPEIGVEELTVLSEAWRAGTASILRAATEDGRPGQPIVFDAALRPALALLQGDTGARDLVSDGPVDLVALPGERARLDLDTPEAWADWDASRSGR